MHQGAWLAWAVCGGLAAMSTTNPFYLAPIFAGAWFVHATCRRPGPRERAFRMFVVFGLVALVVRTALVVFGPINTGSVLTSVLEGLRLLVMLSVFGAFNSVADPYRMVRLAPRRFHEVALASALALSIAPRTIEAAGKVREAQRMRGMNASRVRALPALAVPVLATGMEEAVTLAESMDARGHGRGPRTRYRPDPWTVRSLLTLGTSVTAVVVFYGFAWTGRGSLLAPSAPVSWPDASPVLVVATLLLAAPGFACLWGNRS